MSASVFDQKNLIPTDAMLSHELGSAIDWLQQICTFIENDLGSLSHDWKYYGQKSGWVLKLIHRKRNLLFVIPLQGSFNVVFTFGEKAFLKILKSELPDYIKTELLDATTYSEGRTIQLHISSEERLQAIFELIKIKHASSTSK